MAQLDPKLEKASKDPSTESLAYQAMASTWYMLNSLLGGTAAMRAAGTDFLPQHDEESSHNYQERLMSSTLFNATELTLDHMVGQPFSDPVTPNTDVPDQVLELFDDIDMLGNNLSTFCREWFREGFAKAFCHVLVEFTPPANDPGANPTPGTPAPPRTLADDQKEGRRPFWSLIRPENVIFARAEMKDGVEQLTHVRIREFYTQQVGFAEIERMRIRVLEPGLFEVWEPVGDDKDNPWVMTDSGESGIDIIPLVTFYANRTGLMQGKSPLEDLGYLNVRHWQSTADQINILTVSRFPMLAVAGAVDQSGASMRIGPRQLLGTRDPQGRFYYVEHTGAAIGAGQKDLDVLERSMSAYGATFLMKRPDRETATSRSIDKNETTSSLKDMVVRFVDTVKQALSLTARWMGIANNEGGTITINTDFDGAGINQAELLALIQARTNGDLSMETFLEELQRRGILSQNFVDTVNKQQLDREQAEADKRQQQQMEAAAKIAAENAPPPAAGGGGEKKPPAGTKPAPSGGGKKPPPK